MSTETPGPVVLRVSTDRERLILEPYPLPRWACGVVAVLGVSVLLWIPWALLGWRVPVGAVVLFVPSEAAGAVVVASLLAGGAGLAFGLGGLAASGPMTFDQPSGQFWRGWRRRPTRQATPLVNIRRVRLDRQGQRSRLLIETDSATLTLASDEHAEAVALPGRQLAEFLGLPLAGL